MAAPRRSLAFIAFALIAACLTAGGPAHASDLKALASDCFSGEVASGEVADAKLRAESCTQLMADPRVDDTARATALMVRGKARLKAGDSDGALTDHASAIELWPENPTLYAGRAETLMMMDRFADAKRDLDQAIELDGAVAIFFTVRGTANIHLEDLTEAVSDLETAIRLDRDAADAHYLLGALYQRLGRPSDALIEFRQAQSLNPSVSRLAEDIERLESELGGI